MRKTIFLSIFLLISLCGVSQSTKFLELKAEVVEKVNSGRWADVLILAPDLTIEEPLRADGYYYTALAFFRMGDANKAKTYLASAQKLNDERMNELVQALENEMRGEDEALRLIKSAIDFELNNQVKRAAETWQKAWNMAKAKQEYAINAVNHYIKLKEYSLALDILEDPHLTNNNEARRLLTLVNEVPQVKNEKEYKRYISAGNNSYNKNELREALTSYQQALRFKSGDLYATDKIKTLEEEIAFTNTRSDINASENYLTNYAQGKYTEQVSQSLALLYNAQIKEAYKYRNIETLKGFESKFSKYLPHDLVNAGKLKSLIEEYYFEVAEKSYEAKLWDEAARNYKAFLEYSALPEKIKYANGRIQKIAKRKSTIENMTGTRFLLYTYDSQSDIGLSIGNLKYKRAGYYLNLKLNHEIFTGFPVNMTTNNAGASDYDGHINKTGDVFIGNISLSGGPTFRIYYPLWAYIGGGGGFFPYLEEAELYDYNGNYIENKWFRNTDKTTFKFFPEAGLKLKAGTAIVVKYGVMYQSKVFHQFGLGFQF